jgi:hypothetical protein
MSTEKQSTHPNTFHDDQVFPQVVRSVDNSILEMHTGMTKREYIATQIMAASVSGDNEARYQCQSHAEYAVRAADALIQALNQ